MKIVTAVLIAGTLIIMGMMKFTNEKHRERYGYAFTELQDARTHAKAQEIVNMWTINGGRAPVRRMMQLDLVFPLFYASLFAVIAWRERRSVWLTRVGRVVAILAIAGGLADLGENTTMLGMGTTVEAADYERMRLFCQIKLAGFIAGVLYMLAAPLLDRLIGRGATPSVVQRGT